LQKGKKPKKLKLNMGYNRL